MSAYAEGHIKLTTSQNVLMREASNRFLVMLNNKIRAGKAAFEDVVRQRLREVVLEGLQVLKSKDVLGELGLDNVDSRLQTIADKLADTLKVQFKAFSSSGTSISGGLTCTAISANFDEILSMKAAYVGTHEFINVVDAVLTAGDQIILADVEYNSHLPPSVLSQYSRTGLGIMTKPKNPRGWRVPPQVSGTVQNNCITRAIEASKIGDFIIGQALILFFS